MRTQFLCLAGAWLASCAASPVASHPGDASVPQMALKDSHAPFPVVTGHEIHIPCAMIPGSKEDEAKDASKAYLVRAPVLTTVGKGPSITNLAM